MAQPNLSREFSDVGSDFKSEGNHREHVPHALTLDQILEKPPAEITHADDDIKAVLTWRTWVTVALAMLGTFAQVYVVVAAASVLGFIIRDLGHADIAAWVISAPLLMQTVVSPIIGRLSDLLDRKYLVVGPATLAMVGALISSRAKEMSTLIGGGVLIGAVLATSSIIGAIPAEILPMKHRTLSSGLNFAAGGLAGVVGGLSAGAMIRTKADGWRDIFYFQAALHGATALGFLFIYKPAPRVYPKLTKKQLFWAIDPIGCVLLISGATLLLLALNWGGATYPWSSAHVLAPMIAGIANLIGFGMYEWLGRDDGIAHHALFKRNRNFILSVIAFSTEGFLFFSAVNTYTPMIVLNLGFEDNSWDISIRQLSYGITSLVAVGPIAWYAGRFKDIKTPLLFTFTLFLIPCIGYAFIAPTSQGNKMQYAWNVLAGAGQAGPLTLLVAAVQFASPHAYLATATGLAFSGRAIGGSFGSAVVSAIVNNKMKSYPEKVGNAAIAAGLPSSSVPSLLAALASGTGLADVPENNAEITTAAVTASRYAYANAYKYSYITIIPFVVLSMICVLCLKSVETQFTEHVDSAVEDTKQGNHDAVVKGEA